MILRRGEIIFYYHFLAIQLFTSPSVTSGLSRSFSSASFVARMEGELESIRAAGTWQEKKWYFVLVLLICFYIFRKAERVIRGPQGVTVETEGKGKVLNFCANNYLGFSVSGAGRQRRIL